MNQDRYPDNNRRDYDDRSRDNSGSQSSEEIRTDIEQTRAQMGAKLDLIQEKLDPNRLKVQAQDAVRDVLTDTANQITDYVKSNRDQLTQTVTSAIKRNPVPAALIGLGIGWILVESFSDDDSSSSSRSIRRQRVDYDRTYSEGYRPNYSASYTQGYPQSGQTYTSQSAGMNTLGSNLGQGSSDLTSGSQTGMGGQSSSSTSSSEYQPAGSNYGASNYSGNYSSESNVGQSYTREANGHQGRNGWQQSQEWQRADQQSSGPLSQIKDKAQDLTSNVKERMGDAMENIRNQAGQMSENMRDQAGNMGNRVQHNMQSMGNRAQSMGYRAQGGMNRMGGQMGGYASAWGEQARYQSRMAGYQVRRTMEDNPLTYGLLALAAGVAVGMLLPQTRTENRYIGQYRDQMMDRAREMGNTAVQHAQQTFEEVRPELEQTAQRLGEQVKDAGRQAMQEVRSTAETVKDTAQSHAGSAAGEIGRQAGISSQSGQSGQSSQMGQSGSTSIGSTTGSSTGSTVANAANAAGATVNRDVMKGQWNQIKGEVKQRWGKLTDDEVTQAEGDYDKFVGTLQKHYGYEKAKAEREVEDFLRSRSLIS